MKITEDDDFMYVNVLGNSIFVVLERRMVLITNEDLFRRFFKKKRESFFFAPRHPILLTLERFSTTNSAYEQRR